MFVVVEVFRDASTQFYLGVPKKHDWSYDAVG